VRPAGVLSLLPVFKAKLSVAEICAHWSQEINQSLNDILAFLEGGWWRGEIKGESAVTRLELLKKIFNWARDRPPGGIVFVTPQDVNLPQGEEMPDGGVSFHYDDLQRVRIVVPSTDPDTWSEASCASAFETLAETPSLEYYREWSPVFLAMTLAHGEFMQWLTACKMELPRFWRLSLDYTLLNRAPNASTLPIGAGQRFRKRGRKPDKLERVKEAMRGDIVDGRQTSDGLQNMREKTLAEKYGASRDTARKARTAVLSEFVEESNRDK
jgi:hypothetical protein